MSFESFYHSYSERLHQALNAGDPAPIYTLAEDLADCAKTGRHVFICGNGGSAGNAIHLANDLIYGISKIFGQGIRVQSLSANPAIMTCLANDEGYERIYSYQLSIQAQPGDVLIVLSGSGNSPNIIKALETAKEKGVKSYGLLGYSGGKAKEICDVPVHFEIDDMQISEDLQLIVGHMIMQWIYAHKETVFEGT